MGRRKTKKKPSKTMLPRRKLLLEALEQRLLLSADFVFAADLQQDPLLPDQTTISSEFQNVTSDLTADSTFFDPLAVVDTSLTAPLEQAASSYQQSLSDKDSSGVSVDATAMQIQLLIIDSGIEDYGTLYEEFLSQAGVIEDSSAPLDIDYYSDRTLEQQAELNEGLETKVFVLDSAVDGIEQISSILDQYQDVSAVHLLSHGSQGTLQLGQSELNAQALEEYAETLKQWGESLSADGDILLYGCNLAEGQIGIDFVESLADYTDADIAASTDATGSSALDGDWLLEYQTGGIESDTIAAYGYAHLLANINGTGGDDILTGNIGSVRP